MSELEIAKLLARELVRQNCTKDTNDLQAIRVEGTVDLISVVRDLKLMVAMINNG